MVQNTKEPSLIFPAISMSEPSTSLVVNGSSRQSMTGEPVLMGLFRQHVHPLKGALHNIQNGIL